MKNRMFENQLDPVIQRYPKLSKLDSNNILILKGIIDIVGSDGKYWDSYEVEIHPHENYPDSFPILFEVSGKIPQNPDWHINQDGSCCTIVLPAEIVACKKGITVLLYIEKYVIPFLANQTYRKLTGNFANGEYSHGVAGIIEFYENLFETKNFGTMRTLTEWIMKNSRPKRANLCFCGSLKKFRHCHSQIYNKVIEIGVDNVYHHLTQIILNPI